MTKTIALAGKGGTGKTTVAALLIRSLLPHVRGPILAIDADPAANLHLALGLPKPTTVGEIREQMSEKAKAGQLGVSISRHEYLDYEIRMALEEGEAIDLLTMGRPEGQGCYCAVNHLLRQIVDNLGRKYDFVVIDNEAGMEHISRRTTRDVDLLLLVTDPTMRGVRTADEMGQLAQELEVNIHQTKLIMNRAQGELPQPLLDAMDQLEFEVIATIPADENVNYMDAIGQPLVELNGDSPAYQAVETLTTRILSSP
jgi:CO dehydrogenase maturation factor